MSFVVKVFAVAALIALSSCASAHQLEPYDLCEVGCVKRIYRDYCGDVPCVFGASSDAEKNALCSVTCMDQLMGDAMYECLFEKDHGRDDFDVVVNTFLQQILSKTDIHQWCRPSHVCLHRRLL